MEVPSDRLAGRSLTETNDQARDDETSPNRGEATVGGSILADVHLPEALETWCDPSKVGVETQPTWTADWQIQPQRARDR